MHDVQVEYGTEPDGASSGVAEASDVLDRVMLQNCFRRPLPSFAELPGPALLPTIDSDEKLAAIDTSPETEALPDPS